ncbi:hypothetical protein [Psychromarinibacter sp. S121]|uniref:hypothetical protein n=1 Tax=Psychromarinibacter sp. S121 TaxID=3415127 RepID=UPI003C7B90DC
MAFCPDGTLWEGLTPARPDGPRTLIWETDTLAMIVAEVPTVFDTVEVSLSAGELAGMIDDMAPPPEGSEELGRFALAGDDFPAFSRATRQAEDGLVELVSLHALGTTIVSVRTVAQAERLTHDHALRHEQALKAIVETGL